MAQGLPPNVDLGQSQQHSLYIATFTTYSLAVIAVALRLVSRRLKRMRLWYDDWLVMIALGIATGFQTVFTLWLERGLGLHVYRLTMSEIRFGLIALWSGVMMYTFVLAAIKLSILSFYWRIFGTRTSIRLPIRVLIGVVIAWLIARFFNSLFQCVPIHAYWDRTVPAKCVDDKKSFLVGLSLHLATDLCILALPIPYISQLTISTRRKIAICGMFLLGGFVCFATSMSIVSCARLDERSPDITWNFAPIALWGSMEVNLAIVGSCLPSLRPVFAVFFGKDQASEDGPSWRSPFAPRRRRRVNVDTLDSSHLWTDGSAESNVKSNITSDSGEVVPKPEVVRVRAEKGAQA